MFDHEQGQKGNIGEMNSQWRRNGGDYRIREEDKWSGRRKRRRKGGDYGIREEEELGGGKGKSDNWERWEKSE